MPKKRRGIVSLYVLTLGRRRQVTENLTFNVAQLLKEPLGSTRTGEVVAELGRIAPDLVEKEVNEGAMLAGRVRFMHSQGGVLVQGMLETVAGLPCSRCLRPVSVPLRFEIEEMYAPTVDIVTGRTMTMEEEDRALWIDERHLLDLEEVARQDLALAVPAHVLCREDCRGLCPSCGQDLNEGLCACEAESDPRWGALAELLK